MAWTASPIALSGHRPTNAVWVLYNDANGEDAGAFATGGDVLLATAAAALNIGDSVYLSAAFTVNKSNVAGNQVLVAGVIVGGVPRSVESGTLEVIQRAGDIGKQAAAANDPVLVAVSGLAVCVADGAITAGASVKLSTTTAGQVTAATVATDQGKILGKAWDAASGAGVLLRVLVALA